MELEDCPDQAFRAGERVVCLSEDGPTGVRLVGHGADGRAEWTVPLERPPAGVVADARHVLISGHGGLRVVNAATGLVRQELDDLPGARHGAISPAGSTALIGGNTLARINLTSFETTSSTPCVDHVQALALGDQTAIVLCRDGTLHTTLRAGEPTVAHLEPSLRAHDLLWTALRDDETMVALREDSTLVSIDPVSGTYRALARLPGRTTSRVVHGRRMLSTSHQAGIELRDLHTGLILASLPHPGATGLRLDDTAAELVSDGVLYRYALPETVVVGTFEAATGVFPVRISPDGQQIAAAGVDGVLYTWSLDGRNAAAVPVSRDGAALKWLDYTPDGHALGVSILGDEASRVVDRTTLAPGEPWTGIRRPARRALWLEGLVLAAYYDQTVRAVTTEGAPIPELTLHLEVDDAAADAAKHRAVLAARTGELVRVETRPRSIRQVAVVPDARFVAVSPSGASWAVATRSEVSVHPWDSDQASAVVAVSEPPRSLAITDDLVFLGFSDGRIEAHDHTGAVVALLEGHRDRLASLQVSADERRLVSGSWDGTVRVWSIEVLDMDVNDLIRANLSNDTSR